MANVRDIEQKMQLCNAAAKVARLSFDVTSQLDSRRHSLSALSDHSRSHTLLQTQYRPRPTTLVEEPDGVKFSIGCPDSSSSSDNSSTTGSYTELNAVTVHTGRGGSEINKENEADDKSGGQNKKDQQVNIEIDESLSNECKNVVQPRSRLKWFPSFRRKIFDKKETREKGRCDEDSVEQCDMIPKVVLSDGTSVVSDI